MLNIILFGPPGGGKGTQSQKLLANYNLVHLSTGEMLRKEIAARTPIGIIAQKLIDEGFFAPDEIVIKMIETAIDNNADAKGFLFDGFPRTIAQCEALDRILTRHSCEVTVLLSLEVSEEESIRRLLQRGLTSGRPDDADEHVIRERIEEYHHKTTPVKAYYSQLGKMVSVQGEGSVDNIFRLACVAVDKSMEAVMNN